MKTYERECIAPPFITLALDGGKWSISRLGYFISEVPRIGDSLDPRAGLEAVRNTTIQIPLSFEE
jgi:hypothetical protein